MAFPGGRGAHPESQNEEENVKSLRKNKKKWSKFGEKMRKVERLPTRDCEASYALVWFQVQLVPHAEDGERFLRNIHSIKTVSVVESFELPLII